LAEGLADQENERRDVVVLTRVADEDINGRKDGAKGVSCGKGLHSPDALKQARFAELGFGFDHPDHEGQPDSFAARIADFLSFLFATVDD